MLRPILDRKRDLIYLTFFLTHIPIMLLVDLVPLYPQNFVPVPLLHLRSWYIVTFKDKLFTPAAPAFFGMYTWMEALYHLPVSVWFVGALWRDDPKVPLQLLLFAVQTAITTMTCLSEGMGWVELNAAEKASWASLYASYLGVAVFMGVDAYGRLDWLISQKTEEKEGKGKKKEL